MTKEYVYDHELGIAGIRDPLSGIGVYTLVQQPGIKKAAFNAYAGARYSRSDKSMFEILKEVVKTAIGKGVSTDEHAANRVEQIVHSYGHPSVADMSHNLICFENIPMVTMMRFFYLNPKQDGQERSTRFQDFSKPNFWIPDSCKRDDLYQSILHKSIDGYNTLKDETYGTLKSNFHISENAEAEAKALEARTFDTLRHLIPMGMRTSGCAVMSSRDWSRYISHMGGSNQNVENVLATLLLELLMGTDELKGMGYVPESDVLIRHSEPNESHTITINTLKGLLSSSKGGVIWDQLPDAKDHQGAFLANPAINFADHLALLFGNKTITGEVDFINKDFFTKASEVIFKTHHHYNQLGPIFQSGSIGMKGLLDIGALKDFNRQRSLERFIPFCENNVEKDALLGNTYKLCEYLYHPGLRTLRAKYETILDDIYNSIHEYSFGHFDIEELRYLFPHAHQTPYRIYGSLDDEMYVQMLRIRPGGHINYRMEAWHWREWMRRSPVFGMKELWQHIPITEPRPLSREEFINRS